MDHLTWPAIGDKKEKPFDVAPQVQQLQGQPELEQTQRDRGGRGAGAHGIHQPVTSLDAEAAAIHLKDLARVHLQLPDDDIGEVSSPMPCVTTFAVLADHHNSERLLAVLGAGTRIGGLVDLTPLQQGLGSALLTANGRGDDGGRSLLFRIGDHPIVVEPSIQIQASGLQTKPFAAFQQAFHYIHHLVRAAQQGNGQRVALVVLENAQRPTAVEMGCPMLGGTASDMLIFVVMLPMIRDLSHIQCTRSRLFQQVFGQAGHQQFVHPLSQLLQYCLIYQHLAHQGPHRVRAGRIFQQTAGRLGCHPFHRRRDQHIPDVLRFLQTVRHTQLEHLLQRFARQLVHFLRRHLLVFLASWVILALSHLSLLLVGVWERQLGWLRLAHFSNFDYSLRSTDNG